MKRKVLAVALLVALQAALATAAPPAPPPPAMHGGARAGSSYNYPYGPYPYRGSYQFAPGGWYRYPGTVRYYEGPANPASKYPLGGAAQTGPTTSYWYW